MNTLKELENNLEPNTYAELVRISCTDATVCDLFIEADKYHIPSHEILVRMIIRLAEQKEEYRNKLLYQAQTSSLLYEN